VAKSAPPNPGHAAGDAHATIAHPFARRCDPGPTKEVDLLNPLAIGVTLGGLLLDVVAPRPKPRAGYQLPAGPRTPQGAAMDEQNEGSPIASGVFVH
jgi:hypothetical protein